VELADLIGESSPEYSMERLRIVRHRLIGIYRRCNRRGVDAARGRDSGNRRAQSTQFGCNRRAEPDQIRPVKLELEPF
jgi:hypothetical protein